MNSTAKLATIVCPETHQALSEAEPKLLSQINALIREEKICNRAGTRLQDSLDAALVREDRQLLFGVCDGIPKMILDEAIPLAQVDQHG